jgi:hypothetical protein
MKSINLVSAAAALLFCAEPALARHINYSPSRPAQSIFCATGSRETLIANTVITSNGPSGGSEAPGTAYSTMLASITQLSFPGECGLNAQGQVLFGAHQ